MKKKILLQTSGFKHSLYNSLIEDPPDGTEVIYSKDGIDQYSEILHKKSVLAKLLRVKIPFVPFNLVKSYMNQKIK